MVLACGGRLGGRALWGRREGRLPASLSVGGMHRVDCMLICRKAFPCLHAMQSSAEHDVLMGFAGAATDAHKRAHAASRGHQVIVKLACASALSVIRSLLHDGVLMMRDPWIDKQPNL